MLQDVGVEGQEKIKEAKVLVVGAGGLGAPVSLYLAAAGVGTIGIIDGDVVDLSNLQRQVESRGLFLVENYYSSGIGKSYGASSDDSHIRLMKSSVMAVFHFVVFTVRSKSNVGSKR